MERWKPIQDFEDYLVSDLGMITRSRTTNRTLSYHRNQRGILSVTLRRGGVQYRRSVAGIVARAFVPNCGGKWDVEFNTPIHLDGDKDNCAADNLAWRPRWFAIRFHQQFDSIPPAWRNPVVDLDTGTTYDSLVDAAKTHGFLMRGLIPRANGIIERSPWPTDLKLAYIAKK